MEFELKILVFEQAKTVHALNHAATLVGTINIYIILIDIHLQFINITDKNSMLELFA
jgi:hypothetical protein